MHQPCGDTLEQVLDRIRLWTIAGVNSDCQTEAADESLERATALAAAVLLHPRHRAAAMLTIVDRLVAAMAIIGGVSDMIDRGAIQLEELDAIFDVE